MPVVIVSPHLDDAVLSCGRLLAGNPGSVVVTVFAGRPDDGRWGHWDRQCFDPGDDPLTIRYGEDERALEQLQATAVWLNFLDSQYRRRADADESFTSAITSDLTAALDAVEGPVYVPLGADHPDHLLVSSLGLVTASRREWRLYEELPYAHVAPTWMTRRVEAIGELEPWLPALGPATEKVAAVREYASQLRGLGRSRIMVFAPERYWGPSSASRSRFANQL